MCYHTTCSSLGGVGVCVQLLGTIIVQSIFKTWNTHNFLLLKMIFDFYRFNRHHFCWYESELQAIVWFLYFLMRLYTMFWVCIVVVVLSQFFFVHFLFHIISFLFVSHFFPFHLWLWWHLQFVFLFFFVKVIFASFSYTSSHLVCKIRVA